MENSQRLRPAEVPESLSFFSPRRRRRRRRRRRLSATRLGGCGVENSEKESKSNEDRFDDRSSDFVDEQLLLFYRTKLSRKPKPRSNAERLGGSPPREIHRIIPSFGGSQRR